jgi:hypothetical protein
VQETLTQENAKYIRSIVESEVAKKFGIDSRTQKGQAFGGDFLVLMVSQILIPIFTSLASSGLYDVLKEKALGSLSKKEAEEVNQKFVGHSVNSDNPLSTESLTALKGQLLPLGFTEAEIKQIYEKVQVALHSSKKGDTP